MNKIRKGDIIKVISGSYKGKTGKVIKTSLNKNRILVEGINIVKKHMKPSQESPQGGIIEKEMSIHISNIMLTIKDKPIKVGFESDKNGKKYRINKQTNKKID
jgi:large subunit ribosomal protein L24